MAERHREAEQSRAVIADRDQVARFEPALARLESVRTRLATAQAKGLEALAALLLPEVEAVATVRTELASALAEVKET